MTSAQAQHVTFMVVKARIVAAPASPHAAEFWDQVRAHRRTPLTLRVHTHIAYSDAMPSHIDRPSSKEITAAYVWRGTCKLLVGSSAESPRVNSSVQTGTECTRRVKRIEDFYRMISAAYTRLAIAATQVHTVWTQRRKLAAEITEDGVSPDMAAYLTEIFAARRLRTGVRREQAMWEAGMFYRHLLTDHLEPNEINRLAHDVVLEGYLDSIPGRDTRRELTVYPECVSHILREQADKKYKVVGKTAVALLAVILWILSSLITMFALQTAHVANHTRFALFCVYTLLYWSVVVPGLVSGICRKRGDQR